MSGALLTSQRLCSALTPNFLVCIYIYIYMYYSLIAVHQTQLDGSKRSVN
jgi:hypothetical protein